MQMRVDVERLNFRSAPIVEPATLIRTLDIATPVEVLADAERTGWVKAKVLVEGVEREGFLSARYLRARDSGVD